MTSSIACAKKHRGGSERDELAKNCGVIRILQAGDKTHDDAKPEKSRSRFNATFGTERVPNEKKQWNMPAQRDHRMMRRLREEEWRQTKCERGGERPCDVHAPVTRDKIKR